MPIDASIALQAKAPDPADAASKFMTLGNLANSYKAGQIANTANAADLAEKQGLRSLADDPSVHNPDGSINQDAYQQKAQQVAPTLGADQSSRSTVAQQHQTQSKQSMFDLQQGVQKAGQTALGSIAADPRTSSGDPEQVSSAISDGVQMAMQGGVPGHVAMSMAAPLLMAAHQNPAQVPQLVKNYIAAANGPQGVASSITPNYMSTGGQFTNVSPYAAGQSAPTNIAGTIAPGTQDTPTTDQLGNTTIQHRAPQGNITGYTAPPSPAGGAAAPAPMMAYPAGESAGTKATLEGERATAKNAANIAPQMHANNQGILNALQGVTSVGVTGATVAKLESILGAAPGTLKGSTDAEKAASAYDEIGKYTQKNAIAAAASMGPQTNAGLDAAIHANGSQAFNPTALKTITKLNDAIVTGAEKYSQGLDAAVQSSPNQIFAKRQFDTQWAQNADVNTLKFLNAYKTGDTDEQQAVVKAVGGQGSPGYQKLVKQMQNLQSLTTKGSL